MELTSNAGKKPKWALRVALTFALMSMASLSLLVQSYAKSFQATFTVTLSQPIRTSVRSDHGRFVMAFTYKTAPYLVSSTDNGTLLPWLNIVWWGNESGEPYARYGVLRPGEIDPLSIPKTEYSWGIDVPYWLSTFIFGAISMRAWLPRFLAHRRVTLAGNCSKCGYDLRASKDRCPECGTPIPPVASSPPKSETQQ